MDLVINQCDNNNTIIGEHRCILCNKTFSKKANLLQHSKVHLTPKPHACDLCGRGFSAKSDLAKHVQSHTGEKPFQCQLCCKSFTRSTSVTLHIRIVHQKEKNVQCGVCSAQFFNNCQLRHHMITHTGERSHKCQSCNRAFATSYGLALHVNAAHRKLVHHCKVCNKEYSHVVSLQQHERRHEQPAYYSCEICPKAFHSSSELTTHMVVHTGERPYKCGHLNCGKDFKSSSGLHEHVKYVHKRVRSKMCDICHKRFTVSGKLRRHQQNVHMKRGGPKAHDCVICCKRFSNKTELFQHYRVHTGERPFKCVAAGCPRTFSTSGTMRQHYKRMHTSGVKLKLLKCVFCSGNFASKSMLDFHLLTIHIHERPYFCKNECGAEFKTSRDAKLHLRKHFMKKQFSCRACPEEFAYSFDLLAHMKESHRGQKRYACVFCGYLSATMWNLHLHLRRHLKERPSFCRVCGDEFYNNSDRSNHAKKYHF